MKSKWYEFKDRAIKLRKRGVSINKIENLYGIPRSTQSGWFKNINLSTFQRKRLKENSKSALKLAREKAILWHNAQKEKRIKEAQRQALLSLKRINIKDKNILELALSILYLGEGSKKNSETIIANSDPLILNFFLSSLKKIYNFDLSKIRCELYLRSDQNPQKMKSYWAKELNLSLDNFKQISIDKRSIGSKTFPYYKGVCAIRCGSVAIQRKLIYLANYFCIKASK